MATQAEVREAITRKIVDALKAGTAPWRRPWRADLANAGAPANLVSRKNYRGVNTLLLGLTGYRSRWWATYAQVQAAGGRVRKGERATRIVFWRQVERARVNAAGIEEAETFPMLRRYCVFNVEQTDGLDEYLARPRSARPFEDFGPAEAVLAATGADIRHGGRRAYYQPDGDFIQMPARESFEGRADYYSTLAHEACHWTGHDSRLNRLVKNARFGSHAYAVEELVAEMGGAFLCTEIGVPQSGDLSNHAAYLASWLAVLRADLTAIFAAAGQASRAADFILESGRKEEEAGEEDRAEVNVG